MLDFHKSSINGALRKVLKRFHYPLEVMLTCVRWYVAYPLSLRQIEEMMQERGVFVGHATVHRWTIKMLPVLAAVFRRRKRPVGTSWRMDETYIKVTGQWKYLYRAVDRAGDTVDFLLTAKRDLAVILECSNHHRWYRNHAHDPQGADGLLRRINRIPGQSDPQLGLLNDRPIAHHFSAYPPYRDKTPSRQHRHQSRLWARKKSITPGI